MRSNGCGLQRGVEQGRKFESDVRVQRRDGDALEGGLVLRAFDNRTRISSTFIFVMGRGIFLVLATGEELEAGGGFQ